VHDDGYFDERVAARYDESAAGMFDPAVVDPAVDLLAELAGGGRALELGIGTGRIALPLAARGVPVHGIDLSHAMAARLRAKPGGEEIGVTVGDFATARVEGMFSLAYVVFNTIENLTTQDAQVACFRNVAAHLEPGGVFVVEVEVPAVQWLAPGETMRVFDAGETHWGIDEVDVERQGLVSHHFELVDGRFERLSMPFRYVWPAELDLMAQLAGMTLLERWGGWKREPFTSESRKHVSVWQKNAVRALPAEGTLRLSFPDEGLRLDDLVVRVPRPGDEDAVAAAFADEELREAGNLPALTRDELTEALPHIGALVASGRLAPLVVVDAGSGEVLGGGTLHHLDAERSVLEIGYWLYPHARGRGIATRLARVLAEHAFSLSVQRVAAYVNVGNVESERVLERAGFTREGVVRSLPKPDGRRVDKTLFSLLPGE
jgi:RimJ/RimL family protein N-acetyltransferase/SAM-dependent methyltransferase